MSRHRVAGAPAPRPRPSPLALFCLPVRRSRVGVLCLLASLLILSGCSGMGRFSPGADPFRSADENQISIQVENLSSEDIRMAVLGPSRRHDLGNINPRSTNRYEVPWSSTEPLRIRIEPATGSPHNLPPVTVAPGDHLELFLHIPASRSILRR